MRLLYPNDPFQTKNPDENYIGEHAAAVAAGFSASLFSHENFSTGQFRSLPDFLPGELVCYRGWMLSITDYQRLWDAIVAAGAIPLTSPEEYKRCHYLPEWYSALVDHTPETLFFNEDEDVVTALQDKGWTTCFLKDYVKSLSTHGGSLVTSLETIPEVIKKMKKYRGLIEGGLCVRRVEDFVTSTEHRYFVYKGMAYSSSDDVPKLVVDITEKIKSPFFSVDTIEKQDGSLRIVELGDGQVSDLKNWSPDQFINIFKVSR